jgi:hypothetical protein
MEGPFDGPPSQLGHGLAKRIAGFIVGRFPSRLAPTPREAAAPTGTIHRSGTCHGLGAAHKIHGEKQEVVYQKSTPGAPEGIVSAGK